MEPDPSHAAILFADIAGSTHLYESVGDAAALEVIQRCLDMMCRVCEERDGRVVRTIGDEVMAVFASPANAGYASIDMQTRIAAIGTKGGTSMALHAGFHAGPVIRTDDDVFGDTVNVAARLRALAKTGQILVTADTLQGLPAALRSRTRSLDLHSVKGKDVDVEVHELLWQETEDDLTALAPRQAMRAARLFLRYRDQEIDASGVASLTLGRDASCNVVIQGRKASRLHARIERRRDKYALIDVSTNGTFLVVPGEPDVELRREEALLRGHGRIYFGPPSLADAADEVVDFETGNPDE
jgi:class 3 adenylate cyclase